MSNRKIYNEVIVVWNDETNSYDTIYEDSYYHDGDIYQMARKVEGEIDISGGENAKKALDEIAKAAKKVTKTFRGSNKVTAENTDIMKLLASKTNAANNSVTALVKANKKQIETLLKIKSLNRAVAAERKAASDNLAMTRKEVKVVNAKAAKTVIVFLL